MTPKEEAIHLLRLLEPNCTDKDLVACTANIAIVEFELSCGPPLTYWGYDDMAPTVDIIQKALEAWRTR